MVPGKSVHTVKAFTGRLKTRAVICGNYLDHVFSKEQKFAAGADSTLIRCLLRLVATENWDLGALDVRTAFLLAPLLYQEERPTLVTVPKLFQQAKICQEKFWRVKKALYGLKTSPKSWGTFRDKTTRQMENEFQGKRVSFVQSKVDESLWFVMWGGVRSVVIASYVDFQGWLSLWARCFRNSGSAPPLSGCRLVR